MGKTKAPDATANGTRGCEMMLNWNCSLLKKMHDFCLCQAWRESSGSDNGGDTEERCVPHRRSKALCDFYGGRCRRVMESDRLHRWWPSSVNIQIKSGMSVSLCVQLFLRQWMRAQIKGVGVRVFKQGEVVKQKKSWIAIHCLCNPFCLVELY